MAKKKGLGTGAIIGIVVAAIVVIIILWVIGAYNGLVNADVNVDNAWAQVETQYQRRADLIPNLVATVQGAADFEQETLIAVTEARSRWQQATTGGSIEERVVAANQMESALARLLVTVEAYPAITATQNFRDFQVQLEGTENRISVERKRYNDAVGIINKKVRFFPTNIIASMFGFGKRTFFEAVEGAEEAPSVEFT
ncbi:hypothetical protein AYK26_06090 [Euryarchaeota archaeon SM23-78]|nr:MAG: hypothetical protein AYK26_06090 [Euryarchaeota archaeon SM23-78]